jgi:hypothetical protein
MDARRRLALAGFLLLGFVSAGQASAAETLPVDRVQPGMVGEGLTVFSGDKLEPFKVHVLGVLRNFGPKQNLILARLEGGPLAETGVIAGMSGSPVYIEGKLVGAVAYSFPFSKEPIAGITPIEEMIAATESGAPRRSLRAMSLPLDPKSLLSFEAVAPPRAAPVPIQGTSLLGREQLSPYLGRVLAPIATPASLHGFTREGFDAVAPLLRQFGLEPLLGGSVMPSTAQIETTPGAGAREIRPGDAIGVGLVAGDFDISAVGTVTHVDAANGNVYAFGHPMFNLGPIEYPMTRATVHVVIPNLQSSFKLASTGEVVGTWLQDRIAAIRGVRGTKPRMIPLSVTVTTSRGQERSYQLQLVNDELFSPVLTFVSLISVLQATEREFGTHTVKVSAWISVAGERRVNIEDVFAEQQPAISASAMVAAPLSFLMTNDFKALEIREVKVALDASETPQTSTLVRAWLDRSRVSRGSSVPLNLLLRSYRGEENLKKVDVEIPENIGEGKLQLLVADASTVTSLERREMGDRFTPRNLDQLIRAINGLRKNNRLYVRLTRNEPGAIVRGEYMSSLPPSVLNVLQADRSSSGYIPIQNSTLWESELTIDQSVSGSRVLELEVKNP